MTSLGIDVHLLSGDPGLATHKEFAVRAVFGKPLDFAALRRAVADQSEAG